MYNRVCFKEGNFLNKKENSVANIYRTSFHYVHVDNSVYLNIALYVSTFIATPYSATPPSPFRHYQNKE